MILKFTRLWKSLEKMNEMKNMALKHKKMEFVKC